jgi:parallel beta-helix repeat protein
MANQKISDLQPLGTRPDPADEFEVLDTSDQSMAPTGTNKRVKFEFLATPLLGGSRTFYFSSEGDDANDGLSPQTAWLSPEDKINGLSTAILPGDVFALRRGDVFQMPTDTEIEIGRDGTPLNRCKIVAYGTGPRPQLIGDTTSDMIKVSGSYWTIEGIEFSNPRGKGVYFFQNPTVNAKGQTLRDCFIRDCGGFGFSTYPFSDPLIGADDMVLEDNEFARNSNGIYIYAYLATITQFPPPSKNITIRNNYIHDNNSIGIYVAGWDGGLIENNRVINHNGTGGIVVDASWNMKIRYNESAGNKGTDPSFQGCGILLYRNNKDSIVEFNYVHECYGDGIGYYQRSTLPQERNTIRFNVIQNAAIGGVQTTYPRAAIYANGGTGNKVYNNTIYISDEFAVNGNQLAYGIYITGAPVVRNNAVMIDGSPFQVTNMTAVNANWSNNFGWAANGGAFGTPDPTTWTEADPGFVYPGKAGFVGFGKVGLAGEVFRHYALKNLSPLIDAGFEFTDPADEYPTRDFARQAITVATPPVGAIESRRVNTGASTAGPYHRGTFMGALQGYVANYLFADLPVLPPFGTLAVITDASAISYRAVAAGGGTDLALVMFDGANWIYH